VVGMDDLTIEDEDGDRLTLCGHGMDEWDDTAVIQIRDRGVHVGKDAARAMVAWLCDAFSLTALHTTEALTTTPTNDLRITVPGVSGGEREIYWSGEGAPPDWMAVLAELAVMGNLQHRREAGGAPTVDQAQGLLGWISNEFRRAGFPEDRSVASVVLELLSERSTAEQRDAPALLWMDSQLQRMQSQLQQARSELDTVKADRKTTEGALKLVKMAHRQDKVRLAAALEVLSDMRYELSTDDTAATPSTGPNGVMAYDNAVIETWHRRISDVLTANAPTD
jgi:hypothetical protein